MTHIEALQTRRREITEELLSLRALRPGNINNQYVQGTRRGKPVARGPYPVLCWREGDKVFSERLTTPAKLAQAQHDTANYRRFKALCKELEELTRRLGELERDEGAELERVKKGRKSRSSKARKSGG